MSESLSPLSLSDIKPKMQLKGVVKRIGLAGALVDVGIEGCDALLHISQVKGRHVNNVRDVLSEGQEITVWVRNVDPVRCRIDLTMHKPPTLDWEEIQEGQVLTGKVVRIEKFGVFVDIGAERPGLVHISELADGYVNTPSEVVQKGDVVEVKVIGVNRRKNQIDLSMKALATPAQPESRDEQSEVPTAMALALQRALAESDMRAHLAERQSSTRRSSQQKRSEQDDILRRTLEQHEGEKR